MDSRFYRNDSGLLVMLDTVYASGFTPTPAAILASSEASPQMVGAESHHAFNPTQTHARSGRLRRFFDRWGGANRAAR